MALLRRELNSQRRKVLTRFILFTALKNSGRYIRYIIDLPKTQAL